MDILRLVDLVDLVDLSLVDLVELEADWNKIETSEVHVLSMAWRLCIARWRIAQGASTSAAAARSVLGAQAVVRLGVRLF